MWNGLSAPDRPNAQAALLIDDSELVTILLRLAARMQPPAVVGIHRMRACSQPATPRRKDQVDLGNIVATGLE